MRMGDFPDAVQVVSEVEVGCAYERLAAGLQPHVSGGECVLISILMGGLIPAARLAGMLTGDFAIDCCRVSRYRGGVKGGELQLLHPPQSNLDRKTVLLVDDIYDEGRTLDYMVSACRERGAADIVSAVLVRKRHDRAVDGVQPDLIGLEIDDHYVFGCGMDYQNRWRHLPAIYALRDEGPNEEQDDGR